MRSGSDLQALADRLERVEAKLEIQDTLMRLCRGVDRGDPELMRSAFHENAYIRYGTHEFRAASAFVDWVVPTMDAFTTPAERHTTNYYIRLEGNAAAVESYFIAFNPFSGEDGSEVLTFVGGRYLDWFERRDGRWLIAERSVIVDWSRANLGDKEQPQLEGYLPAGRREADSSHSLFTGVRPSELGPAR
jgi:hypothetical protein